MAQITGGIIREISYSNPDVGSGFFYGVEGETGTYTLGGLVNKADPMVNGNFALMIEKQVIAGTIEMTVSNDMGKDTPDLETAYALAGSLKDTTWTFANTNGEVYTGKGAIVDTPSADGNKSSFTLKVAAGEGFVKQ